VQITGSPHVSLSSANSVSLSAITVDLSLSSASFTISLSNSQHKGKGAGGGQFAKKGSGSGDAAKSTPKASEKPKSLPKAKPASTPRMEEWLAKIEAKSKTPKEVATQAAEIQPKVEKAIKSISPLSSADKKTSAEIVEKHSRTLMQRLGAGADRTMQIIGGLGIMGLGAGLGLMGGAAIGANPLLLMMGMPQTLFDGAIKCFSVGLDQVTGANNSAERDDSDDHSERPAGRTYEDMSAEDKKLSAAGDSPMSMDEIKKLAKEYYDGILADWEKAKGFSDTAVDVSLSSALKTQKDKAMPFPPKKKDADAPPDAPADGAPPEGIEPPADGEPGEDLDGGDPVLEAEEVPGPTGASGEEASAMQELAGEISELGVEVHTSAHENTLSMIRHLITAIKTHKSTKAGGVAEPAADQPDPNQPDPNQNPNNEAEYTESAPIMMSAALTPDPRVEKMAKVILTKNLTGLSERINTLRTRGYIDDAIKGELVAKLGTVKLSASDLDDDFNVKPHEVGIIVGAYERLMKTGKAGSFAKPGAKPAPTVNPLKPISSSVSLSSAREEVIDPPYMDGAEPSGDGELVPEVLDRMTGGRYSEYAKSQKA
jgi:hypothetical protein